MRQTSLDCVIENNSFHDVDPERQGHGLRSTAGATRAARDVVIRNNHFYNLGNNDSILSQLRGQRRLSWTTA